MRILFFCHEFRKENLRLMPWRYIYEVSKGLSKKGHEISVLSVEGSENPGLAPEDVSVSYIRPKDILNGKVSKELCRQSDCIVWSSSPLTTFYRYSFEGLNKPFILLFTGPFYSLPEIVAAQLCRVPFRQLVTHYRNAIVPLGLTKAFLKKPFVRHAVCLSERNAAILKEKGGLEEKITVIPPGYDGPDRDLFGSTSVNDMRESLALPKEKKILAYFGSLYRIRGVDMLLNAFQNVCKRRDDIELLILARTTEQGGEKSLERRVSSLGIEKATHIVPGFLGEAQVQRYLYASDAVVLPFILVPSDMPLGAFEAMALGKPVITTDIDGMPEIVRDSGVLVKGEKELATAISGIFGDTGEYLVKRQKCLDYSRSVPSWREITDRFEALLVNEIS